MRYFWPTVSFFAAPCLYLYTSLRVVHQLEQRLAQQVCLSAVRTLSQAGLAPFEDCCFGGGAGQQRRHSGQRSSAAIQDSAAEGHMAATGSLLSRLPTLYLAHGGGPFPVLGEPGHAGLVRFMEAWPATMPQPSAIVVVSAHWEASVARVTSAPQPDLLYDYYGFPPEAYTIKYPAPGQPVLARRIVETLKAAGIECVPDSKRNYDHGHFIPLKLMYPAADIPTVQLSLLSSLDPEAHIRMGEALAPLREQGVLILGSGLSFHNMAAFDFRGRGSPEALKRSKEFDEFLHDTLTSPAYSWEERRARLVRWADAPSARFAHPREEHLLPLMVAFGAARGEPAKAVFNDKLLGTWVSSFQFGEAS